MAIDDNTIYGLYGSQIKDLPEKIKAVKGKARELTTDDYNYPANNPDGVALWTLGPGIYYNDNNVKVYTDSTNSYTISSTNIITVSGNIADIATTNYNSTSTDIRRVNTSNGSLSSVRTVLSTDNVVNNLTSTSSTRPLSAMQGKVLKDLIDSIAIRGAGAPTTSTVGQVGTLYEDTTNGDLYICTDATNPYVWEEVGAGGGGGVTELTTADLDYPDNNPTSVALWRLDPGVYSIGSDTFTGAANASGEFSSFIGQSIIIVAKYSSVSTSIVAFDILSNASWLFRTTTATGAKGTAARISPSVVQTTGTSTTDIMSQNATSSMVFADPSTKRRVQIGIGANAATIDSISIGYSSAANNGDRGVAIGREASAQGENSIAIGYGASTVTKGVMAIGSNYLTAGYNDSQYRLLTGLYDPQNAHDAATKGYVDTAVGAKQDVLTAGDNITIAEESGALVISATGGSSIDTFTTNEWNALWA